MQIYFECKTLAGKICSHQMFNFFFALFLQMEKELTNNMPDNNNAAGSKFRHKPSSNSKQRTSHEHSRQLHLRKVRTRKRGLHQNGEGSPQNEDTRPQNGDYTTRSLSLDRDRPSLYFDSALPVPELPFYASAVIVAAFCLVAHWNGCHGDFVFDDLEAIVTNKDLRPETPVWNLFRHDFWGEPSVGKREP